MLLLQLDSKDPVPHSALHRGQLLELLLPALVAERDIGPLITTV